MIKLILILAYVVVFGAFAVIFLFYGRKKGWRGGAAVMISAAVAFAGSYFSAPALASALFGIQPVTQLMEDAADAAAGSGLDSAALIGILSDAVQRILEIPSAIVLYILIFVAAFVLTKVVMKFVKPKNAETEKSSKAVGAALGAAAPILVAVLTLFVSKIDLFAEADTVDSLLTLTSKSDSEIAAQILDDPVSYTELLFGTTLTGADEAQRLELINKSLSSVISNTGDQLLIQCFDFEGYSSRSELEADIVAIAALYKAFDGIDPFAGGDLAEKVFSVADKEGMARDLYSLSFKDCIIRYVISYTVQELTGSKDFLCPKDALTAGTYEDFARLVTTVEKYEKGGMSQLDLLSELKDSPLLPREVYSELYSEVISSIGADLFG